MGLLRRNESTQLPKMWFKAGILAGNPKRVCLPKVWAYLERGKGRGSREEKRVMKKTCCSRSFLGVFR